MKKFVDKLIGRLEECVKLAEEYGEILEKVEQLNNGWIPCSERLPEDGQWVIFTLDEEVVDNDDVMTGYYDARKNWCVNEAYFPNAFRFIAWQPLPEPYKAGEMNELEQSK